MTAVTMDTVVEQFLEFKRALGRKYHSEEAELRLLLRFVRQLVLQRHYSVI